MLQCFVAIIHCRLTNWEFDTRQTEEGPQNPDGSSGSRVELVHQATHRDMCYRCHIRYRMGPLDVMFLSREEAAYLIASLCVCAIAGISWIDNKDTTKNPNASQQQNKNNQEFHKVFC